MPRTSSEQFAELKPFIMGAVVFFVFGVFALLLELQSESFVQWDGIEVHGDTYAGVTTYSYGGQEYSIDNTAVSVTNLHHIPTTVWLPRNAPDDPARAFIDSPIDRWTDFAFLTGWFIAVDVVLTVGLLRSFLRRRRRDRAALAGEGFGTGLDPELVQRILAERSQSPGKRAQ